MGLGFLVYYLYDWYCLLSSHEKLWNSYFMSLSIVVFVLYRLKGQRCSKVKRCFSAESWFVFVFLLAQPESYPIMPCCPSLCHLVRTDLAKNRALHVSIVHQIKERWTCREARRRRAASAELRCTRAIHKSSIFSNICGSDLIGRDWSLNHLQEERFRCTRVCSFCPLDSANKQHTLIQTKAHPEPERLMWSCAGKEPSGFKRIPVFGHTDLMLALYWTRHFSCFASGWLLTWDSPVQRHLLNALLYRRECDFCCDVFMEVRFGQTQ